MKSVILFVAASALIGGAVDAQETGVPAYPANWNGGAPLPPVGQTSYAQRQGYHAEAQGSYLEPQVCRTQQRVFHAEPRQYHAEPQGAHVEPNEFHAEIQGCRAEAPSYVVQYVQPTVIIYANQRSYGTQPVDPYYSPAPISANRTVLCPVNARCAVVAGPFRGTIPGQQSTGYSAGYSAGNMAQVYYPSSPLGQGRQYQSQSGYVATSQSDSDHR